MMPVLMAAALKLPVALLAADYGASCTISNSKDLFFIIPVWWEYVPTKIDNATGQCAVAFNFPSDIWAVGLAVLDMLLRIGGFVAVISIIIAGIQYITATGDPEKGKSARRRLTNSLIGLAIVLIASGAVEFIGKAIGG